ncbi:UNVERIFIED_CONTAM: hypothetical protein FKN15_054319 [Acipenser sinensis]
MAQYGSLDGDAITRTLISLQGESSPGVCLLLAHEKGQLVFLEGLQRTLDMLLQDGPVPDTAQPFVFLRSPVPELRGPFEFVHLSLLFTEEEVAAWGPPVLLVDDLSALLSLGVSLGAVLDFVHYCRGAVYSGMQRMDTNSQYNVASGNTGSGKADSSSRGNSGSGKAANITAVSGNADSGATSSSHSTTGSRKAGSSSKDSCGSGKAASGNAGNCKANSGLHPWHCLQRKD